MEFKFRAVDGRSRTFCFPSSSSSYSHMPGQAFRPHPNFPLPDAVQWELEKAQVREEIIASEIARRRAIEAEVRMELALERQVAAMHQTSESGLSFEQRLTMRFDPRCPFLHHVGNNHCWRPDERFDYLPPPPAPPLMPPFLSPPPMLQPGVTEILDSEVKATPEQNKDKLIVLAKPDPNRVVGTKRKTPPLTDAGELHRPLISLKNKHRNEWSCAICQVSATCEKGLTEHLQGRKHKAREAKLKAEAMEKNSNSNTMPLPKKAIKLDKVAELPVTTGLGSEDTEKSKGNVDELPSKKEKKENFRKKLKNNSLQKKHGSTAADNKVEGTPELTKTKKFKFWCQICMVGTYSEGVMENHKKGRKHIAGLKKLEENNAATPATTTNTVTEHESSEGTHMPKDTENNAAIPATTTNTVTEHESSEGTQMPKDTENNAAIPATTTNTVTEHESSEGTQTPKDTENNAAIPATTTDTVTEHESSEGTQMPKGTDVVTNEANEKLTVVEETDSCNLSPIVK
ncbi:Zinc finger, U1-type [Corchorus capsularis]|uniref:Zinc finger, U1-type n=1 Tax=Corchorus capsularis TaxID=210143 RepID=A0A1R3GUJ8_COCAP|nr:Zinc finger, U1-type [Corchorus capsularis]